MDVAVDKSIHHSVTEFFDIPPESILPVLEEIYCEANLEQMKKHMIRYENQESFTGGDVYSQYGPMVFNILSSNAKK